MTSLPEPQRCKDEHMSRAKTAKIHRLIDLTQHSTLFHMIIHSYIRFSPEIQKNNRTSRNSRYTSFVNPDATILIVTLGEGTPIAKGVAQITKGMFIFRFPPLAGRACWEFCAMVFDQVGTWARSFRSMGIDLLFGRSIVY